MEARDAGASPLFSPALGFLGRDWFAELHRRRQCWVSSVLLDVPPLPPPAAGPLRQPLQSTR